MRGTSCAFLGADNFNVRPSMRRIIKKPGYVFRFPTVAGCYGYSQWLPHDVRFFLVSTVESLPLESVVSLPIAFRVPVFRDTPSKYGWEYVGTALYPVEYESPQIYAKQNKLTKKITLYRGEKESRDEQEATFDEVRGFETAAVWAHPHIVERLLATISGVPSKFLESIKVKPV